MLASATATRPRLSTLGLVPNEGSILRTGRGRTGSEVGWFTGALTATSPGTIGIPARMRSRTS